MQLASSAQFQRVVLQFVQTYGLLAVFVYLTLETSLLLHFVPSEVVIPVAAAALVTGPLSFAAFVLVATAGATLGSLIAYFLFGRNGARILDRYGSYVHVSQADVEWWGRWFRRWGESSVFWGRLLPFVRALISVPAGAAEMPLRRFITYSAAGGFLYNASITYLVFTGKQAGSPVRDLFVAAGQLLRLNFTYIRTHAAVVLVEVLIIVGACLLLWWKRTWIRTHPGPAKRLTLHVVRIGGFLVGLLLLSSALSVPNQAFTSLTWLWNDPLFFTNRGLSRGQTLVFLGCLSIFGTLLVSTIVSRLSVLQYYRWVRRLFQFEQ